MARKVLNVTMSTMECNLGSLEPDRLFKDQEISRFAQACSIAQKDFAILRADGLQLQNEKKQTPKADISGLSYDERAEFGKRIGETLREKKYDSIVFYVFSGVDEAPYIHILECSAVSYQVIKRLSRIGGEKVAAIQTSQKQKTVALTENDVRLLYKCRGSMEMELGRQVKETEVVRLLMETFLKSKKIEF